MKFLQFYGAADLSLQIDRFRMWLLIKIYKIICVFDSMEVWGRRKLSVAENELLAVLQKGRGDELNSLQLFNINGLFSSPQIHMIAARNEHQPTETIILLVFQSNVCFMLYLLSNDSISPTQSNINWQTVIVIVTDRIGNSFHFYAWIMTRPGL